jgi:ABC-type sugar transport system ATPase subunit
MSADRVAGPPVTGRGRRTSDAVIELRGVRKRHRWSGRLILRDVTLEVPAGTGVEISGPDGADKSTLVRILAGASVPTGGRPCPPGAHVPTGGARRAAPGLAVG